MGALEKQLRKLAKKDAAVKQQLHDSGSLSADELSLDTNTVPKNLVRRAKAHAYKDLNFIGAIFSHRGINITVEDSYVENDMWVVVLSADAPTDNPYYFLNPPLGKPTGPFTSEEAPQEIIYTIVGEAVYEVAVRLGWSK